MKKFKLTTWVIVSVLIMIISCKKDEVVEPAPLPIMNFEYVSLSLNTWYSNYFLWITEIELNGHDAILLMGKQNEIADTLYLKHIYNGQEQPAIHNRLFWQYMNIKLIAPEGVTFKKRDIQ